MASQMVQAMASHYASAMQAVPSQTNRQTVQTDHYMHLRMQTHKNVKPQMK